LTDLLPPYIINIEDLERGNEMVYPVYGFGVAVTVGTEVDDFLIGIMDVVQSFLTVAPADFQALASQIADAKRGVAKLKEAYAEYGQVAPRHPDHFTLHFIGASIAAGSDVVRELTIRSFRVDAGKWQFNWNCWEPGTDTSYGTFTLTVEDVDDFLDTVIKLLQP
jgi:hypothetical protein